MVPASPTRALVAVKAARPLTSHPRRGEIDMHRRGAGRTVQQGRGNSNVRDATRNGGSPQGRTAPARAAEGVADRISEGREGGAVLATPPTMA